MFAAVALHMVLPQLLLLSLGVGDMCQDKAIQSQEEEEEER